ncbi:hypothetical protein LUZ60_009804 [Juncus effusus]|nr:hypothetical protein LUZ60_009804 [Juncus effusus]
MEIIKIKTEDAKYWVYKGEGAANVILSYLGSSPNFIGKVLRVQKVPKEQKKTETSSAQLSMHEQLVWGDVAELFESKSKDNLVQNYTKYVMCPLFGTNHIDTGVRVSVSREFLEQIEMRNLDLRPVWRVNASKIDTFTDSALLISDHSVFPGINPNEGVNIAVEIKPKCGFLPSSEYISESNIIKKQITRYKMHQALKFHKGEILERSEYDPLDLFSGSKERIYMAIESLFNAPQNNFRVFLDGSLIYGGMDNNNISYSHNTNISFEELINTRGLNLDLTSFLNLITEIIHKSGILHQLLNAQKLDSYDIEGAIHAYNDVISQPCPICENIQEKGFLEKFEILHNLPIEERIKIVRDYLISATAKDCSIMLSFRPKISGSQNLEKYESVRINSVDQVYDYKVFFIDLDMKPLDKMEYYYKLDQKIVNFYKQNYQNSVSYEADPI